MKLVKSFFLQESVTEVAHALIGKKLCTEINGIFSSGIIVETEAYSYMERACHAYGNKRTRRTETLFMEGGTAYVYLCYGIHHLFNIVTNTAGIAEAVLIRAVQPLEGTDIMMERRGANSVHTNLTSGPGKLTQAMGIRTGHDKVSLLDDCIWVEKVETPVERHIESSPRIGVGYAKVDALLPWRFTMKNSKWISSGNNDYNFK